MSNPYRTICKPSLVLGKRWGITPWKKLYVRVARRFFNLREKYKDQREFNNSLRKYNEEKKKYAEGIVRYPYPAPLPPPIKIME